MRWHVVSTDVYLHTFLVGLVELPALLFLWPAITHLGRRKTLAFLHAVCGASMAVITVLMVTRQEGECWKHGCGSAATITVSTKQVAILVHAAAQDDTS